MKRTPENPVESVNPVMDKKEEGTTNATTKKTTAKKTTAKKAPVAKKTTASKKAPAKRGRPAKKAPANNATAAKRGRPAKQEPAPQENTPIENSPEVERQQDDRLDRILKLTQENSESLYQLGKRVNNVEERVIYMAQNNVKEDNSQIQEDKRNQEVPKPDEKEKKPSRLNDENLKKWLKSDSKLPVWGLIILALLIIFLTVWLDATLHHGPATERIGTTNVIYMSHLDNDSAIDKTVQIEPTGVSIGKEVIIETGDK